MGASRSKIVLKQENVAEKLSEFLSDKKAELVSEKTVATYKGHLNLVLKNYMEEDFDSVDWDVVVSEIKNRGLAEYSVCSYLKTLRAFLRHFNVEVRFHIKRVETIKETYSEDELRALTKKPNKDANFSEWRQYATVLLALDTGLRSGSLRALKQTDVQPDNTVVIRTSKTNKVSILPFSNTTANALKTVIRSVGDMSVWLFPDITGEQLSENGLRLSMDRYCKLRGTKHHSMHLLRHTFAKHYLLNGGNPYLLQKMMMHSDMAQTKQYLDLFSEDLKNNFVSNVESLYIKKIGYKMK